MSGPTASVSHDGSRLHLQHGPIDLVIGVDGERAAAFELATLRFQSLLQEIVDELPDLRETLKPHVKPPLGEAAVRMHLAALPFSDVFLTRMAGVAGAVADTVLLAMQQVPLRRAYVNNGGDIALYLAEGERFDMAMARADGVDLGRIVVTPDMGVGGVATSGRFGRSLTMGIADSVTVLACDAVTADFAATLIANSVDLPRHPAIQREAATSVHPESDLGARLVVTGLKELQPFEVDKALDAGVARSCAMLDQRQIIGAALFLGGQHRVVGRDGFALP